jgi:hypothetical protein
MADGKAKSSPTAYYRLFSLITAYFSLSRRKFGVRKEAGAVSRVVPSQTRSTRLSQVKPVKYEFASR